MSFCLRKYATGSHPITCPGNAPQGGQFENSITEKTIADRSVLFFLTKVNVLREGADLLGLFRIERVELTVKPRAAP